MVDRCKFRKWDQCELGCSRSGGLVSLSHPSSSGSRSSLPTPSAFLSSGSGVSYSSSSLYPSSSSSTIPSQSSSYNISSYSTREGGLQKSNFVSSYSLDFEIHPDSSLEGEKRFRVFSIRENICYGLGV